MRWARTSVCSTTSRWRRRRPSTRTKSSPLPSSSALTVSLPNYVSETRAAVASSTTLTVSARAREFWLIDLVVYYTTSPYRLHHDGDDDYRALIPSFFFRILSPTRPRREIADGSFSPRVDLYSLKSGRVNIL